MKIKTIPLVSLRRQRYGTRRLQAGDTFDARRGDVAALIAMGNARRSEGAVSTPRTAPKPEPKVAPSATAQVNELEVLRAQYALLAGRRPHNFWKVDKIRAELARMREAETAQASGAPDTDQEAPEA